MLLLRSHKPRALDVFPSRHCFPSVFQVCWFYLVTGRAAWFEQLSVVPSAVDLSIVVEVDQIHQQLATRGAGEARRVPALPRASPGSEHCHFSSVDVFTAL